MASESVRVLSDRAARRPTGRRVASSTGEHLDARLHGGFASAAGETQSIVTVFMLERFRSVSRSVERFHREGEWVRSDTPPSIELEVRASSCFGGV